MIIGEALSEVSKRVETLADIISKELRAVNEPVSLAGNSIGSPIALDVTRANAEK